MPIAGFARAVQDRMCQSCPSLDIFEGHRCQPFRAPNLRNVVTLAVHQTLMRHNLVIDTFEWMVAAVRHTHHDAPAAANAKIDLAHGKARSITTPPLPHVLR